MTDSAESAPHWPARIGAAIFVVALVLVVILVSRHTPPPLPPAPPPVTAQEREMVANLVVTDADQIVVEGAAAEDRNAAIPVASGPLEQVSGFSLAAIGVNPSRETRVTALKCLTQAIYYEAANEPLQGRRAVAQVVLNRMRHPAYPHSVCGVVYQGSSRRTGCQFSFTCDGSLLRTPARSLYASAENLAREALAGHVERGVGTATHYHADYVLPKWAFTLGKINQIGRHIFYRFPGGWGRSGAFTARYAGGESIPALNYASWRAQDDLAATSAGSDVIAGDTPATATAGLYTDRRVIESAGRVNVTKLWKLAPSALGERNGPRGRPGAANPLVGDEPDRFDSLGPPPQSNGPVHAGGN